MTNCQRLTDGALVVPSPPLRAVTHAPRPSSLPLPDNPTTNPRIFSNFSRRHPVSGGSDSAPTNRFVAIDSNERICVRFLKCDTTTRGFILSTLPLYFTFQHTNTYVCASTADLGFGLWPADKAGGMHGQWLGAAVTVSWLRHSELFRMGHYRSITTLLVVVELELEYSSSISVWCKLCTYELLLELQQKA